MAHRICSIDGCAKAVRARGWCAAHYDRWRKYGDPRETRQAPIAAGAKFGRLTVREVTGRDGSGARIYTCDCECGGTTETVGSRLKSGHTRSCGCLQREAAASTGAGHLRHGHKTRGAGATPTYSTWQAVVHRCTNPRSTVWWYYGGRGITVCERWRSFENFLADMGERPAGKTLDRIDPDGHYEPGNCRWATPLEQRHNRRAE